MILSSAVALAVALTPQAEHAKEFVSVPINTQSGLPTLRATVSGKPVTLILDLGGYKGIALTPGALSKLDVTYDPHVETWRNSTGEVFTAKLFSAPEVKLGEQSVGAVDGIEYASTTPGVDGYVGFAVLRNFTVVLDYPHNEVRLYPQVTGALERECGSGHAIPIEVVGGVVQSKVTTERGDLVFQWDTGASENVLRPSAIDLGPDTSIPSHVFKRFELGGRDYGRTRIPLREFVAPNVDGVLGGEFFGSRMVCLDFNKKTAAIR
jgi:hypothetical protein